MSNAAPECEASGANLKALFEPQSIAVIGASRREESVGHAVFKNLLLGGYQGIIYPVNPKAKSIFGVRCYKSIIEIEDAIDLAILIIPAKACLTTFKDCIDKGVKSAIIISAGFRETGPQGKALEDQIKLAIRNGLSRLLETRESIQIQAEAVRVAERRVASTKLFLEAGRSEIRDLLEAQDALVTAQNALTAALISYRVSELALQRDLGVLMVDERGLWREYDPGKRTD